MRYLILISSILSSLSVLVAQNVFDVEPYLKAAFNDQAVSAFDSQLNFLNNNNYNSPLLQRVEIRVGSEGLATTPEEYRLRLSPSNPSEIKANRVYHKKQIGSLNAERTIAVSDALYNRYRLIIDLANLIELKKLINKRIVYQKKLSGFTNENGSTINIKDLVSLHSNQTKLLLRQEELATRMIELVHLIELDFPGVSTSVDSVANLVKVPQIKEFSTRAIDLNSNIRFDALKQDLELDEQELKIEKAEARSNIGYIQSNYDTDKKGDFVDQIGFQVGVRLPIVNPDKPKLNRIRVDLIEQKAETETKLNELQQTIELKKKLLLREISRYETILERINSANTIPVSGNMNIEWQQIMLLKNYQFALLEEKIKSESKIRETYIEILNYEGKLISSPIRNYLSSKRSELNK